MNITYHFDDGLPFEYDTDFSEYIDSLNSEELVEIAKNIYLSKDIIEQEDIANEFGTQAVTFDPSEELSLNLAKVLVNDATEEEIFDMYRENIEDFYEKAARDEYEDSVASEDKYGYFGVSERDFY